MYTHNNFIFKASRVLKLASSPDGYYVIHLDIVNFQAMNRAYGFEAGGHILEDLRLHFCKQSYVLVCERIFSDQFLLLIHIEGKNEQEVTEMCNAMFEQFLEKCRATYSKCAFNISSGICPVGDDLGSAVDDANLARKQAKKLKLYFPIFCDDDMRTRVEEAFGREEQINRALSKKRFIYFLQPQVSLTDGKIIGVEALARWVDESGCIVGPEEFMDLLEQSGAVVELDMIIYRRVCQDLGFRIRRKQGAVKTSVNLSRRHLIYPDMAQQLHNIALEFKIPPDMLEFELTETIFLEDFTAAKSLINDLRAYGYSVAIDDFGSGYAGMNLWQELSFDVLKLDKNFLSEEPEVAARNRVLVPNIINIADRLHTTILCEGVETAAQCEYLMRLGCTTVQGYYFSRPLPEPEFYQLYDLNGGYFPCNFDDSTPALKPKSASKHAKRKRKIQNKRRLVKYALQLCLCIAVLVAMVMAIVSYSSIRIHEDFRDVAAETLVANAELQRSLLEARISDVANSAEYLSALMGYAESRELIDVYVAELNVGTDVRFSYMSMEEDRRQAEAGGFQEEDLRMFERLSEGETVISDIVYSSHEGGEYYFGIGVPVYNNDVLTGVLRGVLSASVLTEVQDTVVTEAVDSVLADSAGYVIPTAVGFENAGMNYIDYFVRKYDTRISSDGIVTGVQGVAIREIANGEYYLMLVDLGYNGWKLATLVQNEQLTGYARSITSHMTGEVVFITVGVLGVAIIIFVLWRQLAKTANRRAEQYELLEEFSDVALFSYDPKTDTIRFSVNAKELVDIDALEVSGFIKNKDLHVFSGDEEQVQNMLEGKLPEGEMRVRLRQSDGSYLWRMLQYRYVDSEGGRPMVIGKMTDIEEMKHREDELLSRALTDPLTGLLRRGYATQRISERLTDCDKGLMLMIDVDNFKEINDDYGHMKGDDALRFIATCLNRTFRGNDIIARYGGDEMMCFMAGTNDIEIARTRGDGLLDMVARYNCGDGGITVSIGISRFPEDGENTEELLEAADRAMYGAKDRGKSRICFYSELSMTEKVAEKLAPRNKWQLSSGDYTENNNS